MNKTTIYYDFEATSVSRDADPISIGMIAVTEGEYPTTFDKDRKDCACIGTCKRPVIKAFYGEFTDFNKEKCDDWVKKNIVGNLMLARNSLEPFDETIIVDLASGSVDFMGKQINKWLSQFEELKFYADFDVIDKPMLIDMIADWETKNIVADTSHMEDVKTKIGLPKHRRNVRYYDFYDIHTLFEDRGINPDINREYFLGDVSKQLKHFSDITGISGLKHNALWDAFVTYKCHKKLNYLPSKDC